MVTNDDQATGYSRGWEACNTWWESHLRSCLGDAGVALYRESLAQRASKLVEVTGVIRFDGQGRPMVLQLRLNDGSPS